jgi:hypothetical protein
VVEMAGDHAIFKQTYKNYLYQVLRMDLSQTASNIDVLAKDNLAVTFFNTKYVIAKDSIKNTAGKQTDYDICIVLFKYIIMCPNYE